MGDKCTIQLVFSSNFLTLLYKEQILAHNIVTFVKSLLQKTRRLAQARKNMKNICYLLVLLLLCMPCFADEKAKDKKEHDLWITDMAKAKELAKKHKKLIIMDFTGSDWCYWCVKLKKEVFDHKEFKEYAKEKFVCLELDFPAKKKLPAKLKEQNDKAKKKYAIRGYPTIIVIDHEGNEIARTGYKKGGPVNYVKHLTSILAEYYAEQKKK